MERTAQQETKATANQTHPPARMKAAQIKKVGLLGPFGFGNLGDGAIQQAMIRNIRRLCPDAEIIGFSLNPQDTLDRHGIPCFPIGRMAKNGWQEEGNTNSWIQRALNTTNEWRSTMVLPFRLINKFIIRPVMEVLATLSASRRLTDMDLMIVSGGGQLDDYWGGAWHHPYTLLMWALLSKLRGTKYLFVSVGAGPLDLPLSRFFIRQALSLASYRSYRDMDSKIYIEKIGFKQDDPVYPDLAFSLDPNDYPNWTDPLPYKSVVGIGPMDYFDPRVWPERDQKVYWTYVSKLADFTAWLIEHNYAVRLFTGEAVYDRPVIDDLRKILAEKGVKAGEGQIIEEPIETVDDLMNQLAAVDFVIASRFHGVLLSLLMKKPVLAISYHPKIDSLMKDTGQAKYCLSINDFQVDQMKERFLALETNRAAVEQEITGCVQQYQNALDEQYEHIFCE